MKKYFYKLMNRRLGCESVYHFRRDLLAHAKGNVLEIGFGTGLNLACYPPHIKSITAIDFTHIKPDNKLSRISVDMTTMSAEAIGFPDASFDTVVSTFTLCSIKNVQAALAEIRRVLTPQGKFLFLEHGKSPHILISTIQELANPFYELLAFGCHVNRDIPKIITGHGFQIESQKVIRTSFLISGLYYCGISHPLEHRL